MKACFKCGRCLPLTEFYRHPRMADGHLGKCKECVKRDVRENRVRRADYYRAFDSERARLPHRVQARREYARTPEGRAAHARALKRHAEQHPERAIARYTVGNAIRDGRMQRGPCEDCGDPNTQAHHPDYSKPLEVVWLCERHHLARHGKRLV